MAVEFSAQACVPPLIVIATNSYLSIVQLGGAYIAQRASNSVSLFWDDISEGAIDSLTLYADFQGYRIYKSQDYGATWGPIDSLILSQNGDTLGWRPYAIFDYSEEQDTTYCL